MLRRVAHALNEFRDECRLGLVRARNQLFRTVLATSLVCYLLLALAIGVEVPREEVLAGFCNHFEQMHLQVLAGDNSAFQAWRDRLVTLGREVVATGSTETIRGRAIDVDADGALVIEKADGTRVRVEAGDVTLSAREGNST